jgi:hypothetical protein
MFIGVGHLVVSKRDNKCTQHGKAVEVFCLVLKAPACYSLKIQNTVAHNNHYISQMK